jgi:hypothetical protein
MRLRFLRRRCAEPLVPGCYPLGESRRPTSRQLPRQFRDELSRHEVIRVFLPLPVVADLDDRHDRNPCPHELLRREVSERAPVLSEFISNAPKVVNVLGVAAEVLICRDPEPALRVVCHGSRSVGRSLGPRCGNVTRRDADCCRSPRYDALRPFTNIAAPINSANSSTSATNQITFRR